MSRNLSALLTAYVVSIAGDWGFKIAVPVLVFKLTGSPLQMSVAFACSFAPYVVMMPIGGALADAMRRQRILYLGDFASAILTAAIGTFLSLGGTNVYAIYPAIVGLGVVSSIYHPAFQGFLPSVVDRAALPKANAYFTASDNTLNFAGPAFAAVLVAAFDPTLIVWSDAVSFLVSGLLILGIVPGTPEVAKRAALSTARIRQDLRDGFLVVWNDPVIRWGTIMFVGENLATNMILGNEIFYLTEVLGLPLSEAGLVMGLSAVAAIVGSLAAPWLIRRHAAGRLIVVFVAVIGIGTSVFLTAPWLGVLAVLTGRSIVMAARAVVIVTMFTYRQRAIPQGYLGRAVAIQRSVSYVAVPLAALAGGFVLAKTGSMQIVIGSSVLVLCVSTAVGLVSPIWKRNATSEEDRLAKSA